MEATKTMKAKVSGKGWVVIPAILRRRYGLKPGSFVEFKQKKGRIELIPQELDPIEMTYGKLADTPSLTRSLLDEKRKELYREETKIYPR